MIKEKQTEESLTEINQQQPTIKFTIEKELHNSINFLDLSIHRSGKVRICNIQKPHSNRYNNMQRLLPSTGT
jgi:hypothetical protein